MHDTDGKNVANKKLDMEDSDWDKRDVEPNPKWQEYTQALVDKSVVLGFAVYSRTSKQPWTSTSGFQVKPSELEYILSGFMDDSRVRFNGIWIEGRHFTVTRLSTNRVMMCGRHATSGIGCVVYPCRSCVLIATHTAQQLATCYSAIEQLGDFLTVNGF